MPSYIGVGPVFPSQTKPFDAVSRIGSAAELAGAEIGLPAFAIGGITAENVAKVRASGFERIAVCGAVTASPAPAEAVGELKSRLA